MIYAGREIPVLFSTDVCVAGGGPSGVAAAIMAARNGAKTVLIERGVALGGLAVWAVSIPLWIHMRRIATRPMWRK